MEDGDDNGHSINDDLRMMGESGDDHEGGGDLGLHDLFGSTAAALIDLATGDVPGDGAGGGSGAGATIANGVPQPQSSVGPRPRKTKSSAWEDIDPINTTVGGKQVRTGAICKWCKSSLSAGSSGGTGHLLRHACDCKVKVATQGKQSQLSFNPDGSVSNFVYCPSRARTQLCRLIARLDLPLTFAESPAFGEYIKLAHNPKFKSVSRQTTTRDFVKYFNDRCSSNGNAKEDYLKKKIIGLRRIEVSHNADNISERVLSVIAEWGCTDKLFSVTLDNASSNVKAMDKLKPALSGYVGTLFLHQRCALHLINLIVKSGLKRFKPWLDDFRTAISFLNASNQRTAAYKSYCVAIDVRPRKFELDMDVRWNSTYLMLKHLLPYKETFDMFLTTQYPRKPGDPELLTPAHWYVAARLLEFIEMFYDATISLSGVYYPTSPLIMHTLLDIAKHLHTYEYDEQIGPVVVPMKKKFLKYWKNIPYLYSIAFILDPRAKLRGFMNILRILSQLGINDYSSYYTDVRAELKNMFNKYDAKFGAVRLQRPSAPTTATEQHLHLLCYKQQALLWWFDDDFNILNWWHEHKLTYYVLSILARDVISVPVSTKSAFSLCGRIIEKRRRCLSPDMVEMLLWIKGRELGDASMQHTVDDKDIEAAYENLYLDVEPDAEAEP
ncbi:hypothetical protein BS78_K323200 [Paspalum vaginatum]|uniref:BED-type domain-containing protein n=1 Tax=Paspalum vaginatum TaxID=158149 RepID=A0A9W8CD27_9POAL|nr:hypothetical protein BS78_K323200 [Paspalum vaginatum]